MYRAAFHLLLILLNNGLAEAAFRDRRPNTSAKQPSGPFRYFKTEPDFEALLVNVTDRTEDPSLLASGYYFLTPFRYNPDDNWGPQIVDQDGHIVWYGQKSVPLMPNSKTTYRRAQDFKVCDYLGIKGQHLCWSEAAGEASQNRVLDSSYKTVTKPFGEFQGWGSPNPHEFNMMPGGRTLLQAVYRKKDHDLRPWGGKIHGTVSDACFQEVMVKNRKVVFSWCLLDHVNLETQTYLDIHGQTNNTTPIAGKGDFFHPWDFAHENSVDKNEEGDFLISVRHMDQLIKIAGKKNVMGKKPGEVVWRVGGDHGDFEMAGNALFSRQHCARFVSTGPTETVVTVFDNAWEGINEATARTSSGMMLTINNSTMKTTLKQMFVHPYKKLSPAQGSVQVLPNSNVAVGWGSLSEFSEFSADGKLLFHGQFSPNGPLISYRAVKHDWIGYPRQPPKLIAYSQTCTITADRNISPLMAYVSWNGATQLASWRFSVSFTTSSGPWIPAGTMRKDGFETTAQLSSEQMVKRATFAPFVQAEALDVNGTVLSHVISATFVPKPFHAKQCNAVECPRRKQYAEEFSHGSKCQVTIHQRVPYWVLLLVVIVAVEGIVLIYQFFWDVLAGNQLFGRRRTGTAQTLGFDDLPPARAMKET